MAESGTRVVVAMSGGVDSSVAAALLVEQGYEVIGIMLRLWSEDNGQAGQACSPHNRCCTPDQMQDARRVADLLGIPFYVLDTRELFRQQVVQYFIDIHASGETPNPCIACNRHIRFTHLLDQALALDARYLATGHYARLRQEEDGAIGLYRGVDAGKDQSYVLSILNQHQLRHVLFPIGEFTKTDVRAMAARFGLPVATKHDSQDLCFLADGDYRRFLRQNMPQPASPGPIATLDGTILGQHTGLADYTIGQRKGLRISHPEPLYVVDKDSAHNMLIVGTLNELGRQELTAREINWISGVTPLAPFHAEAKIRYKALPVPAHVAPLSDTGASVRFSSPLRDITPGQGVVFYDGDRCIGGGIIERPHANSD